MALRSRGIRFLSQARPGSRLPAAGAPLSIQCICLVAAVALYLGWELFWFMTDDALIAFRYVSQSIEGNGFVWNAPPFRPIEGYTSFLWLVVMRLVWVISGVPPTLTANWVLLACGYGMLWLCIRMLLRMVLPESLERQRPLLLGLCLLAILSNRTFLTWISSGLETGLFNLLVLAWVYLCFTAETSRRRSWLLAVSLLAALAALTRPDGLLYVAATLAIAALAMTKPGTAKSFGTWASLLPLVAVPAHFLWRHSFYGSWLPNTYYAKVVGAWPESGVRYLASFMLEYGIYFWLLLLVLALRPNGPLLRALHTRIRNDGLLDYAQRERMTLLPRLICIGTLVAHAGYYTFVVGGDHFEYRVYSHAIPLLFVSGTWLAAWGSIRSARLAPVLLATLALVSWPIPWTHFALTQDIQTRSESIGLTQPVAPSFPGMLQAPVALFDELQSWLIERAVCMRHQEHKVFYEHRTKIFPTREQGSRLGPDLGATMVDPSVGVPGWVLPHVAIIDEFGLNDRVIARNPAQRSGIRQMAHDRKPPRGYLACFGENLKFRTDGLYYLEHLKLRDEDVIACESFDWLASPREDPPPNAADRARARGLPESAVRVVPRPALTTPH